MTVIHVSWDEQANAFKLDDPNWDGEDVVPLHEYNELRDKAHDLANQVMQKEGELQRVMQMFKGGVQLIAQERLRHQAEEGWTPEHDMAYQQQELVLAAICYAMPACRRTTNPPELWPWDAAWWKPGDRQRELVKAAALIAAQLDVELNIGPMRV